MRPAHCFARRYYRNTELDINISTIGIYAFGFGHGPVGWAPPGTPFSPEFEWSFSTLTGIARGIKKWFGTVDALQVNVGVWGNPMIRPTTYEVLKHFTKGDVEAAKDELREMQGAVKEVRVCAHVLHRVCAAIERTRAKNTKCAPL